MALRRRLATALNSVASGPLEERVENIVRKLYPYMNRYRSPIVFRVGQQRVAVHHGGRSDHIFAIYQCFYRRQYELPAPLFTPSYHGDALERRYRDILSRGKRPLVVDCGANIGASAVWYHARYPMARIVAIEPAADNLAMLHRNVQPLGIAVVEGAIGPEDGSAILHHCGDSALAHRVLLEGGGTRVKVVSLRTILAQADDAEPFILKIDIEGGEKTLFGSSPELLSSFPLIAVEPHDFCMPGDNTSRAFLAFHAQQGRDFLFANENIFSIDYKGLTQAAAPCPAAQARAMVFG